MYQQIVLISNREDYGFFLKVYLSQLVFYLMVCTSQILTMTVKSSVILTLKIPPPNRWERRLDYYFALVAQTCFGKAFLQLRHRSAICRCEYKGRATGVCILEVAFYML